MRMTSRTRSRSVWEMLSPLRIRSISSERFATDVVVVRGDKGEEGVATTRDEVFLPLLFLLLLEGAMLVVVVVLD